MAILHHPVALTLIVVILFTALTSAAAQSRQTPRTSLEIQTRIQKSAELQRQALQSLNDRRQAEQLIDKAYVELRGALSSMIINASGMKFQDPLLDMQTRSGEQALSLLQRAGDTLRQNQADRPATEDGKPAGSPTYLDGVRKDLEQALRLTSRLVF